MTEKKGKASSTSAGHLANPFMDSQFKLIFDEESTRLFLNSILELDSPIKELRIKNSESNDESLFGRRVYFDVICSDEDGNNFIVEMQRTWKSSLKNRIIYYTCRKMNEMGRNYTINPVVKEKRQQWDYDIKRVYTICLLNAEDREMIPNEFRQDAILYDTVHQRIFSDKLRIIIINLQMMDIKVMGLERNYYENFLLLLKLISDDMSTKEELLAEIDASPFDEASKTVFRRVVSVSDVSSMDERQRMQYEEERMFFLDSMFLISSERTEGIEEGMAKGRAKGINETAKAMKRKGIPAETIMECTGLSSEQLQCL